MIRNTRLTASVRHLLLMLFIVAAGAQGAWAEDEPSIKDMLDSKAVHEQETAAAASQAHIAHDDYSRDTPRDSVVSFLKAANRYDYERAKHYLDFRNVPEEVLTVGQAELARHLKVVLDKTLWVDISSLSKSNDGHIEDGLPSYRDLLGVIEGPERRYDILLQRVPGPEDRFIWKISNRTVAQLPQLYELFGYNALEEQFAKTIPAFKFLGVESWMWFLFFALLILTFILAKPVCFLLLWLISQWKPSVHFHAKSFIDGPVRLLLMLYMTHYALGFFHFSLEAQAIAKAGTLRILVHTWFLLWVITLLKEYWAYRLQKQGKKDAVVLLKPLATTAKILAVITAALMWLNNIGYDITTLVAGLGIGGLAVALAAQKSLENLIATITIYASGPMKAGDYCMAAGVRGKIEEIGLWSTRIRTMDRSVVFIPNSQLAAGAIENYSMRDKFNFSRILHFAHNTARAEIEQAMEAIRNILEEHSKIDETSSRVHLENIGEFGFEVNVKAFIETTDMTESKHIIADLNLAINQAIQELGIEYAKVLPGMRGQNGQAKA